MPTPGKTLRNPATGDTFEFLETALGTQGAQVLLRSTLHTKGELVPNHLHVLQEEYFEVLSGQLTVRLNGETRVLGPGDSLALPPNEAHNHFNAGDGPVTYLHRIRPALDFDYLMETLVGLAADGKARNGKYGLLQELVSLKYLDSKSYLADVPIGVQKLLMAVLAPLGRLLGYRAVYKKYSGIEK